MAGSSPAITREVTLPIVEGAQVFASLSIVTRGLDPRVHSFGQPQQIEVWMAGSSPVMTTKFGRRRAAIRSAALLLTLLLVAPQPARAGDAPTQWSAQAMMDDLMWNRGPVGGPFTLTDTSGRRRSDGEFRGRLMVIYFGYTSCPDVCPTDLMAIAQAIDALGADGDEVQPIFITVDPARDTPDVLKSYVAAFHPRLLALTGSDAEIRSVATAFKAYYAVVKDPRDGGIRVDHSGVIYLMGRRGEYLGFMPPQTDAARLTEILRKQLGK